MVVWLAGATQLGYQLLAVTLPQLNGCSVVFSLRTIHAGVGWLKIQLILD